MTATAKLLKELVATDLPEAMRQQVKEMLRALMQGEVSLTARGLGFVDKKVAAA